VSEAVLEGTEPPGGVDYGSYAFRVKRWVLAGLADAAAPALPASAAIASLGCFRVRVAEDMLELAATDMERTIIARSSAVSAENIGENAYAQCYIPARKLQAILKEAPDTDVRAEVRKNKAVIAAGGGSWTLTLPDATMYPELVSTQELAFAPYGREKLLAALRAVRHVVCKDAGRPPLTQVEVKDDPDGEGSVVTASDGIRFARAALPRFPVPLCIPSSALDDLTRLLAAESAETVGVCETDETTMFHVGAVTLAVARRSTPFPDMDKLLLQPALENQYTLGLDKDELAAAVRRVRINADGDTAAIVLEVTGESVTVVARDKLSNSATETLAAVWGEARDRVLCVNHAFLSEMLAAHPAKSCTFRVGRDIGKRRSMILLQGEGIIQVIVQMAPALVGY
jgi:DNA polymerase III sliding clamp (beta) subunit (PCNA family)